VAEREGRTVIISGSEDKSIRIWDLERGEMVGAPLTGHTSGVRSLAVAEWSGRTVIVSGSFDGSIRIWDLKSGDLLRTIEVGAPVFSIVSIGTSNIVAGTSLGLVAVQLREV
jgi:WD40 repeat protein